MGKPILGEHSRLEVVIEESCEFKVCEWLGHGPSATVTRGLLPSNSIWGWVYHELAILLLSLKG